jgi:uroporphyrin-III C-methyltransferase/precorrin-2 dehydrogenase/sirohydrochlorin ferrochelatase
MSSPTTQSTSFYPLFLNLRGRRVLVIGGGDAARRKISRLLAAGACVDWVAEEADPALQHEIDAGRIEWLGTALRESHFPGHVLILVAETDAVTAERARAWADKHDVLINVVDRLDQCSAIMPAVVDRSPLMIAISSGGNAPELARMIRSRIETLLPLSLGPLAALVGRLQEGIRQRYPELARRRRFLDWVLTGRPAEEVAAGRENRARLSVERELARGGERTGRVSLVGAGPGEPELLTVRALHRIQSADVLVHDGLVDARILDYARRDAEFIDVSKRPGRCRVTQDEIHAVLVEQARAGKRVVRLKGGDPMIFGRGGEELAWLKAHDIDYEVVPGVTAASACASYAGLPLTQRGYAQSVRLVTAHCERSVDRLDWPALAADHQTLAFYMAVGQLGTVQRKLIDHGRSPSTPVALVENGTRPDQRVVLGRLDELESLARDHAIEPPSMLFIGEVAALARELGWFGNEVRFAESKPQARAALA